MEVFGDDINFLLGFSRKRGRRQNLVDYNWDRFFNVLLVAIVLWNCSRSKFQWNLGSESVSFVVSIESVPFSIIYWRDEVLYGITYTIKISKIVNHITVDLFVPNVLGKEVERHFNTLGVWCKVFDGAIKGNRVEEATPKIGFGWCLWIIRKLDINDFFLVLRVCWGYLIVNMQKPCVILLVSCHTNLLCFLLLCLIRQLKIWYFPWRWKVYISVHPIVIESRMTQRCQWRFSRKFNRRRKISTSYC